MANSIDYEIRELSRSEFSMHDVIQATEEQRQINEPTIYQTRFYFPTGRKVLLHLNPT